MSFRRNVITGEPVLFAPERATRPHAFSRDDAADERCPFCPGHESDTPPEILRLGGDPWRARVFPNKYPPIEGAEVIVESPDHRARFEDLPHAEAIAQLYIDRYRAHSEAAYVAIFKNEGTRAGASIDHLHSQLVPLPFVPPRIARELEGFARAASCPLCTAAEHLIAESDSFRWIAPHASSFSYQQWIVPKRHVGEMSALTGDEIAELASLLGRASSATTRLTASLNWTFMNFPRSPAAHAYIEVLPRMTAVAGFELGTGTFVEIIDPARAAEVLRR